MHPLLNRTVFATQVTLGDGASASSGGAWISADSVACADCGSLRSSAGPSIHADKIRLQKIPRFVVNFIIASLCMMAPRALVLRGDAPRLACGYAIGLAIAAPRGARLCHDQEIVIGVVIGHESPGSEWTPALHTCPVSVRTNHTGGCSGGES
jgi:hypothetical protein